MTYRASALADADDGLIGTAEHGVLGHRWVYDGTCDPVLVGQLVALIHGLAQPQMQSVNDTPDPTVTCVPWTAGARWRSNRRWRWNGPLGTELRVGTPGGDDSPRGQLVIMVTGCSSPTAPVPTTAGRAAPLGDVFPAAGGWPTERRCAGTSPPRGISLTGPDVALAARSPQGTVMDGAGGAAVRSR